MVTCVSRNVMSDYSGEVMAEVLAQQALVKPQIIPLVPIVNQYRHPDHLDLKDCKSKVRPPRPTEPDSYHSGASGP